ncbi:3-deoxy-manno-octulosonate cytidylyltransferase, partial [candidate division KSB1 bacterium]|nr:3-deoxy-manno-octulosonate cytidylyltransferase [candidate division KSB1 bacterium]
VIVATDDDRILQVVQDFGGRAEITSRDIRNGTERTAVVARKYDYPIIVNIQGDEPLIQPDAIDAAIRLLLHDENVVMGTLVKKVETQIEFEDTNMVRVVLDHQNFALYFTRSIIPFCRDQQDKKDWLNVHTYFRHIGLYVYQNDFLQKYIRMPESSLEKAEKLEQLRVLENGYKIKVAIVDYAPRGVDTPQDLEELKTHLRELEIE